MFYLFVVLLVAVFNAALAYEKDMTFTVQAGKTDCLYQHAMPGQVIDIDYQVIDASQGELDISFQLSDPVGRLIVADYKKSENAHKHTAELNGDYRFCFDNTFSTFSHKTVFFDLLIVEEDEETKDYEDKEMELGDSAETYLMRVSDISTSVTRVKDNMAAARRLQEIISAHEARDRNLAEDTCERVLRWSIIQIIIMIVIGLTQLIGILGVLIAACPAVVFVRSLFEDGNSRKNFKKYLPDFVSQ